jgi:hypothetical protein
LLGDERSPLGGRCLELGHEVIYPPVDPIVEKYRRNGRGQPDRRGDQRLADGWGDYGQAGGLGRSYSNERVHDPVDRPEESDERGARGDEGEQPHERAGALPLDKDRAVCHGLQSIEMRARASQVERRNDACAGRPVRPSDIEQILERPRSANLPIEASLGKA